MQYTQCNKQCTSCPRKTVSKQRMFGHKIFVRVQTFWRVPPVLPCNLCHPGAAIYVLVNMWQEGVKPFHCIRMFVMSLKGNEMGSFCEALLSLPSRNLGTPHSYCWAIYNIIYILTASRYCSKRLRNAQHSLYILMCLLRIDIGMEFNRSK